MKYWLWVTLTMVATLACGMEIEDEGFELIRELRIIAIKAEPPEVKPGEVVKLEAVADEPEGRKIVYVWLGPVEDFDPRYGVPDIDSLGWGSSVTWQAPEEGTYTIFVMAYLEEHSEEISKIMSERGRFEEIAQIPHSLGFKYMNVSEKPTNYNPRITAVSIQGAGIKQTLSLGNSKLTINIEKEGKVEIRAYSEDADGDEIWYAWMSTSPGLSSDHGNPVEWEIPKGGGKIFVIARDGRGGVDWVEVEAKVKELEW